MSNILVSSISGDVSNSILKCLHDTDNILLGCDVNDYPVGYDRVSTFHKVPYAIDSQYIPSICEICAQNNITHIIPVNESEISVIDHHRALFSDMRVKLVMLTTDILDICLDKYKTAQFLKESGFFSPKSYLSNDQLPAEESYFVKPRYSSGSKLARCISGQDIAQLDFENTDTKMVIQEYLGNENEEYTVGIFSDGEHIEVIIFRRMLKNGTTVFVELANDETIREDALRLAKLFRLRGSMNVQLRKHNEENYIFEINPRLSGTVHFRHLLGFTDAIWWLDILDEKYSPTYRQKFDKVIGVREYNEKILIAE